MIQLEESVRQRIVNVYIMANLKGFFNKDELKEVFDVYNLITKENKPVTTCSSCVGSVINRIKRYARDNKLV